MAYDPNPKLAATLRRLSSRDDKDRKAALADIAKPGVEPSTDIMRGVINILQGSRNAAVRTRAAVVVTTLAKQSSGRDALREVDAAPPLIGLLQEPDQNSGPAQMAAAFALHKLAEDSRGQIYLREHLPSLRRVSAQDPSVRETLQRVIHSVSGGSLAAAQDAAIPPPGIPTTPLQHVAHASQLVTGMMAEGRPGVVVGKSARVRESVWSPFMAAVDPNQHTGCDKTVCIVNETQKVLYVAATDPAGKTMVTSINAGGSLTRGVDVSTRFAEHNSGSLNLGVRNLGLHGSIRVDASDASKANQVDQHSIQMQCQKAEAITRQQVTVPPATDYYLSLPPGAVAVQLDVWQDEPVRYHVKDLLVYGRQVLRVGAQHIPSIKGETPKDPATKGGATSGGTVSGAMDVRDGWTPVQDMADDDEPQC